MSSSEKKEVSCGSLGAVALLFRPPDVSRLLLVGSRNAVMSVPMPFRLVRESGAVHSSKGAWEGRIGCVELLAIVETAQQTSEWDEGQD